MCYSEEVSLAAFLIGTFGSIIVYTLGSTFDRIIALFLVYVAFMQGIEWLLWRHQQCDDYHKQVSIAGMWLNGLQPVVLGCLTIFLSPRGLANAPAIITIMALYLAYSLQYKNKYTSALQCTTPRPYDPHLVWNWTMLDSFPIMWGVYIVTFVLISVIGMPTLAQGGLFGGVSALGLFGSILLYPRQDVGAMWCFFSSFSPFVYYIVRELGYL